MTEEGKLDASLLALFKACEPWSAREEEEA
jgi:hypothetical protein